MAEEGAVIGYCVAAGVIALVVLCTVICLLVIQKRYNMFTKTHSQAEARSHSIIFLVYAFFFDRGGQDEPKIIYTSPDGASCTEPGVGVITNSGNDSAESPPPCVLRIDNGILREPEGIDNGILGEPDTPIRSSALTYAEIDLTDYVLEQAYVD